MEFFARVYSEEYVTEETAQFTGGNVDLATLVNGLESFGEAATEMLAWLGLPGVAVRKQAVGGRASDTTIPRGASGTRIPNVVGLGAAEE
jgi:hypothetical protein